MTSGVMLFTIAAFKRIPSQTRIDTDTYGPAVFGRPCLTVHVRTETRDSSWKSDVIAPVKQI